MEGVKQTDFWNRRVYVLFNDNDEHYANILDLETYKLESKDYSSLYVEGEGKILAEFELVWPDGVSFESLRYILVEVMENYNQNGIKPHKSYVYDKELKKFKPNT